MSAAVVKLTQNIWGQLRNKADFNVWDLVGIGAPVNGTSGTGVGVAGTGSTYTDPSEDDQLFYLQTGAIDNVNWVAFGALVPSADSITTAMLQSNSVTAAKLSNDALIDKGLGGEFAPYAKDATGINAFLPAITGVDRFVMGFVLVTEVFANGDGAQPTFKIGQDGGDDDYLPTSAFTGKAAGTRISFAGFLNSGNKLIVTATAGTGTTETGAISVYALVGMSLD